MGDWLQPTDERWPAALREAKHDFYHLPCYAALAARSEGAAARAYYQETAKGRVLIPLLIRDLSSVPGNPGGLRDATSPYGYAGAVFTHGIAGSYVTRALLDFVEFGACAGLVTTFLRAHPLLHTPFTQAPARDPRVQVVVHGPTVSIDLTLSTEALDRQLRNSHKQQIRKLRLSGFRVRVDDWDDYPAFQELYYQTMQRHGAQAHYFFDNRYFDEVRGCPGSSLHLCSVVDPGGEIVSGGLFAHVGSIVAYHLSATAERHLSVSPSKLMLYEMRTWAKEAGAEVLHLGGGVGGKRDSLYMFKRGFGTNESAFETVRIVHDPEAYARLKAQWLSYNQQSQFPDDSFFPLYRSPVPIRSPNPR